MSAKSNEGRGSPYCELKREILDELDSCALTSGRVRVYNRYEKDPRRRRLALIFGEIKRR